MTNDECLSVDDPRHPLQMDLAAAEMKAREWRNILDSVQHDARKARWAQRSLIHYTGLAEMLKQRIARQKSEISGQRSVISDQRSEATCPACRKPRADDQVICPLCLRRVRRARPDLLRAWEKEASEMLGDQISLWAIQQLPTVGRPARNAGGVL
jgi:hypothetical protein